MEVLHADPRMRRMAVAIVVAGAVVGGLALWAMQRWLDGMSQPSPAARSQLLMAFTLLIGIAVLALVALGVYLLRYGNRVRAASLFPPPGARVVRDAPVVRGAAALRRGSVLQGIGVLCVLCGIGLAAVAWRFHALFSVHAG